MSGFDGDPYVGSKETFRILFGDSWQYLWPVIVISIFQVLAASLTMSAIDAHFRTGRLTLAHPFRLINYSVFPLTVGVIVMDIVSIVGRFVLFGLVSLVQAITSAAGAPANAAIALISIIAVGLFVVHVLIITPLIYWAPIMFIYGYRFRDAAAMSFKIISGKKLFGGLIVPLLICAAIQMLLAFLGVPAAVEHIVNFLIFLVTNVYVTVYAILTFYGISELDRRDVVKYELSIPSVPIQTKQDVPQSESEKKTEKDMPQPDGESAPERESGEKQQKSARDKTTEKPSAKKSSAKPSKNKSAAKKSRAKKQIEQTEQNGVDGGAREQIGEDGHGV